MSAPSSPSMKAPLLTPLSHQPPLSWSSSRYYTRTAVSLLGVERQREEDLIIHFAGPRHIQELGNLRVTPGHGPETASHTLSSHTVVCVCVGGCVCVCVCVRARASVRVCLCVL